MTPLTLVSEEQFARQRRRENSPLTELWQLLDQVSDPEIPVVSLWDLGVLQDIRREGDKVIVEITPTYSGCPAMVEMAQQISVTLQQAGYQNVEVKTLLAPTWTTEFMTREGRDKLRGYGIAPPVPRSGKGAIQCPQCNSENVQVISEFGSTACKALYRCDDCLEPFDYFKCI